MQQRSIGGHTVSAIGPSGMHLSIEGRPAEDRSIATIHAGFTFIDTADAYPREANEVGHSGKLITRALREYGSGADGVLVATKGGHLTWIRNGDPSTSSVLPRSPLAALASTRSACTNSTAPTRPCRTPTRWARSAISSTRA